MLYLKRFIIFLSVALCIMHIPFKIMPERAYVEVLYYTIPLVYLTVHYKTIIVLWKTLGTNIKRLYRVAFYGIVIAIAWGLCVIVINNGEMSFIRYLIWILLDISNYIFMVMLIGKNWKTNDVWASFSKIYICIMCVYVVSTTVMIFIPEIKFFWQGILFEEIHQSTEELSITRYGLFGFSSVQWAYKVVVACVLLAYLCKYKKVTKLWRIAYLFLILGSIYYARWGAAVLFSLYVIGIIKNISAKKILINMCVLLIGSWILYYGYCYAEDDMMLSTWANWLLVPIEAFVDGLQYGNITFGQSVDQLREEMWFMPDDGTFLIGDGMFKYENGGYYMNTDVGFMRSVLFYGCVGLFIQYIAYIVFLVAIIKHLHQYNIPGNMCLGLTFTYILFLAELKFNVFNHAFGLLFALALAAEMSFIDEKDIL